MEDAKLSCKPIFDAIGTCFSETENGQTAKSICPQSFNAKPIFLSIHGTYSVIKLINGIKLKKLHFVFSLCEKKMSRKRKMG